MPSEHGFDGSKDALQFLKDTMRYRRDPIAFINEVLGVKSLYPTQEATIREFYRDRYDPKAAPYRNFYYLAGMRSGKTAQASMMGCYEFFNVIHLPDPAGHWGLLNNQLISLAAIAATERQVQDGIFYNITNMLEHSEWINTWFDITYRASDIYCPAKNCKIRTLSSNANAAVGRSNIAVLFDELDLFLGTEGATEAWNVFNRVKKSTDTFGPDGHTIAISSPKQVNGIISTLYDRGQVTNALGQRMEPQTLSVKKKSWEANPHLSEEALRNEYRFDMDTFYRDFACEPAAAGGLTFPEGVILSRKPVNMFVGVENNFSHYPHVIAIDPAAKNDSFGAACGYIDPGSGVYVVDGVTKFTAENESYIKPSTVRKFLDIAVRNLNVYALVFDTWMYVDIIEHSEYDLGLFTEKHIVDKEDYDRWRAYQENGMCDVIYDEFLKMEVEALVNKQLATKVRVDHPVRGSKDMADCVANVLWFLTEQYSELATPRSVIIKSF